MSKIMVMGPQDLLMDTLALIQGLGIMHIDDELPAYGREEGSVPAPKLPDRSVVLQYQFYEDLLQRIAELLSLLPEPADPVTDAAPRVSVDSLAGFIAAHLESARSRREQLEVIAATQDELINYLRFLDILGRVATAKELAEDVEYTGFEISGGRDVAELQGRLDQAVEGKAVMEVLAVEDGKQLGAIMVPAGQTEEVHSVLEEFHLPWFQTPVGLEKATVPERMALVRSRLAEIGRKHASLVGEEQKFVDQWQVHYLQARNWLERRISLLRVSAAVVRSRMCFFIHGWLPSASLKTLTRELDGKFGGRVVVEEVELAEQDFARVPIALHNPAYFQPFELFTRLLPMPPYSSFDLTPFIGIFFPIFFGMMLGDVGYGITLIVLALILVRRYRARKNICDAGKILFVSALYAVVFGWLYGEFFGTVGHRFLGMKPIIFDRQAALVPMLCFAVAAGVVHVLLGLVLGIIASMRLKMRREALFRLLNILIIICLCGLALSWYTPSMQVIRQPLLLTVAVFIPVLVLTGGLMAPLEFLKNVGNIISYARIMAVGLTSVLLAFVANYMAGRMGSVWAGILVALVLHLFNLILGVFAPTIHSLRLHYVEFLTKFMEPGGKKFTPLRGK